MKKNILSIRIPTLLGIFLILVTLASTSYLANQGVITIGRASLTQAPQRVRITNVSDTSFTVSYKTETPTLGSLNTGKDKSLGLVINDDRDSQTAKPHVLHYFTVKNLAPNTLYYFSIVSGDTIYTNNNTPFTVTTRELGDTTSSPNSMSGKIITQEATAPQEAIVYVKKSSDPKSISTLVNNDGTYSLDVSKIGIKNNSSDSHILQMLVLGDQKESNITIRSSAIHPVPIITLAKDYDFIQNVLEPSASTSANFQSFPSFNFTSNSTIPQIITPKNEEIFKDAKPQFFGTASASALVKITIHSQDIIQDQVKTDPNGRWSYRPIQPLSPGNHTISITTQDQTGITKSIEKTFIVFASGSQFIEPSASPIPPTPTSSPTITPTPSIPTATPLPPTPTSLLLPSPTIIPPASSTTLPPPGSSTALLTGLKGIGITLAGLLLLILSRGVLHI